jgi:signal transduction histidine kinase
VEVTVADTGEGIRPEDVPHVFERFYRGEKSRSRATGGAGLGLAIARGIIEAHGGEIRVESNLPRGTRFIFSIP